MKSDKWIICRCGSLEHFMRISYETEFDDYVYVTVHLSELPFWKRLKLGILYILGRKSKYGNFEEILLNKENVKEVIDNLTDIYCHMNKSEQNINI